MASQLSGIGDVGLGWSAAELARLLRVKCERMRGQKRRREESSLRQAQMFWWVTNLQARLGLCAVLLLGLQHTDHRPSPAPRSTHPLPLSIR